MLQQHQIKTENSDPTSNAFMKCTCKHEVKEEAGSSNNVKQVLVNFGLNRKKVFTLNGKKNKLHERFKDYILSEPAFSGLLEDSYVVFQEFCEKFGTWVDIDVNESLEDGAVLNAVFFPSNIERDESNPGAIRKKDIQIVHEKDANHSSGTEVIHIDLVDDEDDVDNSEENTKLGKTVKPKKVKAEEYLKEKERSSMKKKKILSEGNLQETENTKPEKNTKAKNVKEEENMKKNKKSMTNYEILAEESISEAVESKPKKAKVSKTDKNRKQEEANNSAWDQNLNLPSAHQHVVHEAHEKIHSPYPENRDYLPVSSLSSRESPQISGDSFISKIYKLCAREDWPVPKFVTTESPYGGFSCKLILNMKTYYAQHSDHSKVKEAVAETAFSFITSPYGENSPTLRHNRGGRYPHYSPYRRNTRTLRPYRGTRSSHY